MEYAHSLLISTAKETRNQ